MEIFPQLRYGLILPQEVRLANGLLIDLLYVFPLSNTKLCKYFQAYRSPAGCYV